MLKSLSIIVFFLSSLTSAFCITADEFKKLEEAANKGDAQSQSELGRCYANSNGVGRDFDKAAMWFRKAAEQGVAKAQYNLGLCYAKGEGVEKDLKKAKEWIKKAKDAGLPHAAETWKNLELWKY